MNMGNEFSMDAGIGMEIRVLFGMGTDDRCGSHCVFLFQA